jgi:hypothetical protein
MTIESACPRAGDCVTLGRVVHSRWRSRVYVTSRVPDSSSGATSDYP